MRISIEPLKNFTPCILLIDCYRLVMPIDHSGPHMIRTSFGFGTDKGAVYLGLFKPHGGQLVSWLSRGIIYPPVVLVRACFGFFEKICLFSWLRVVNQVFIFLRVGLRRWVWFKGHLVLIELKRIIGRLWFWLVTRSWSWHCCFDPSIFLDRVLYFLFDLLGCYLMLQHLLRVPYVFFIREFL